MRQLRAVLPVLVAIVATWTLTTASAQSSIPNGAFVQTSDGWIWLVLDGKRVNVPVWAASDSEIVALPESDQWAVVSVTDAGAIVAGAQPTWLPAGGIGTITGQHPPQPAIVAQVPTVQVPTPTPAPPGNALTFQGLTLTVLRIERPWIPVSTSRSKAGAEYVTVDVQLDNRTAQQIDFNPARLRAVTDDGVRWDRGNARDPYLTSGKVLPGTPMRGWVTFEVPYGRPVIQLLWETGGVETLVLPIRA